MDSIIFIGTNKSGSSREGIKAAKRMGYETILFTDNQKVQAKRWEYPDIDLIVFVPSMFNYDKVRQEIDMLQSRDRIIKAIISFIEPYVYYAASLSAEICHSNLSLEAIRTMEDKSSTRIKLKDHSFSPYFTVISSFKEIELLSPHRLPLVIKSPHSTGSKDVLLARTFDELQLNVHFLLSKYPAKEIILEEFLDGPQYLAEVIVQDGNISIVGIVEQTISEFERFIVTGYSYNPMQIELCNGIDEAVHSIVRGLDLKNGSCHIEMRLVNNQWKLIEVNPRVSGGAMNRMIEVATGINIAEETIKLYVGEAVTLNKQFDKCVFTQQITVGSKGALIKVTGRSRAEAIPGVQEVYIKPKKGMMLRPPESMGDRYGYVIAADTSIHQAKETALRAAKEITFYLEPSALDKLFES
ncbi:ATP-grasp domain-containing protein [Cytobacillus suaedae]|nr:ATP-grasp domain-containing protein [Cytobacillus suaedae]